MVCASVSASRRSGVPAYGLGGELRSKGDAPESLQFTPILPSTLLVIMDPLLRGC